LVLVLASTGLGLKVLLRHVLPLYVSCSTFRRSMSSYANQTLGLIVSLKLTRLDYGHDTVAGLPAYLVLRLQPAIVNAAARSWRIFMSLSSYRARLE